MQTIAFFCDKDVIIKKTIIIVPKTLIINWKNEFNKFAANLKVFLYHGSNRKTVIEDFISEQTAFLITTYHTVLSDIDHLSKICFDCAVIDEVQYIKNFSAKIYSAILKLNTKFKIALSGTPFENNMKELWAIMNIVNPNSFGHYNKFIKRYGLIPSQEDIRRINKLIKPYILRRLKKDILKELPDKIEETIMCSMTENQRDLYDSLFYSIKEELNRLPEKFEIKNTSVALEGLLYLRQICCSPRILNSSLNTNNCEESEKFELFKDIIIKLQANGQKVVVFSQFVKMLDIMQEWLESMNYTIFFLSGNTNNRQELVDSFERSNKGVFLISLKAGGVGLNIISANYAIIYDPWWNPAIENQAIDRIYRIGQNKNVFVYRLITENTVEEKIQKLKKLKSSISEAIFDDMSSFNNLSYDEVMRIFD